MVMTVVAVISCLVSVNSFKLKKLKKLELKSSREMLLHTGSLHFICVEGPFKRTYLSFSWKELFSVLV